MRKIIILSILVLAILQTIQLTGEAAETCHELSMTEKKELLTKTALQYDIPPEILKTIALFETKMNQCNNGEPLISNDGGIGIMQITNTDFEVDEEKLKFDTAYNIEIAAKTLKSKWDMQNNGRIPTVNNGNPQILENWYFAIMAYNGLSPTNDPNEHPGKTYQDRFYVELEKYNNIKVGRVPEIDIVYEDGLIAFPTKQITWSDASTLSSQMLKKGDYAFVYHEQGVSYGNLREQPRLDSSVKKKVPLFEVVEIISEPYVEASNDFNYFVMYEVRGEKFKGYMASSNLKPVQLVTSNQSILETTKQWTIPLQEEIDPNTINSDSIFIVNSDGEKEAITMNYNKDSSEIYVKAQNPLQSEQTYILFIHQLKNTAGVPMEFPVGVKFSITAGDYNSTGITVKINNSIQVFQQEPVIENDRTLVPLRGVFEVLGATVNWDPSTRTVTATKENTNVYLPIGSTEPKVNGTIVSIDTPAKIINDNTMVPLRFISEALGAEVAWDQNTKTVTIRDGSVPITALNNHFIGLPY